ncbi:histidine kinase [bacterium SCSIO 12741]|nr:histidine kinase [bacterium SCSIO 12741]
MEEELSWLLLLIGGILILTIILAFLLFLVKNHLDWSWKEEREKEQLKLEHQKELLRSSVSIQEKERQRIAGELHDNLISQLHRIKLLNQEGAVNDLLKNSIETARTISHDLVPPLLKEVSMQEIILDFIQPYRNKYQFSLGLKGLDSSLLEVDKRLQLFRVFQEVMTNVDKHADTKQVDLRFRETERYCALVVRDYGKGFNSDQATGLGLKNIELRVQVLGGKYRLKSESGKGTTFTLLLSYSASFSKPHSLS